MESKIKIKMGLLEIECEGSESFLEQELPKLLSAISDFYKSAHEDLKVAGVSAANAEVHTHSGKNSSGNIIDFGLNTLAKKLNVTSGSDLIFAAIARLTLGESKNVVTSDEIRKELDLATNFNSKNAKKNFKSFVKTLMSDDKLHDKGADKYALSAAALDNLKIILKDE